MSLGPQPPSPSPSQKPPSPKRPRRTGRKLLSFDRRIGARYIVGADEAGRAPWPDRFSSPASCSTTAPCGAKVRPLALLNDSKQLTHERREELFQAVVGCAERISVHAFSAARIDSDGLHVCNLNGLRLRSRAHAAGEICLVDGFG